jgi:hypothetical protein
VLPEPERVKYKTILKVYSSFYELSINFLDATCAWTELEKKEIIDAESALQTLPEMELVLEGLRRWYDNAYGVFKEINETLLENPAVEKWFDIKVEKWEVWGEYGYAVFLGHHMGLCGQLR